MYDLFRAACSERREGGALRRWASTWNLYCGQEENTCRQVECQNDKVKDSDARECVISCRIPYRWEITHSRALSFFLKVSVSLLLLSFIPVACGGDAVGVSRRVLYRYVFPVKLPVRSCKVKVSK
mgnify:FL=1